MARRARLEPLSVALGLVLLSASSLLAQPVIGVPWEEARGMVQARPIEPRTWLVRDGASAAAIGAPDDPAYRVIAEMLAGRIEALGGARPEIVAAGELVTGPVHAWSEEVLRTPAEGGRNLVLLGDLTSNPAVTRLYGDWLAFEDATWPGVGGWSVRTVVSPTGHGWNAVVLGGPGPDEVRASAEAWAEGLRAEAGGVVVDYRLDVQFGEGRFLEEVLRRLEAARAWPEAWRADRIDPTSAEYRASHPAPDGLSYAYRLLDAHLVYGGLHYALSGEPAFARMAAEGLDTLYRYLPWVEANRRGTYDAHYMIEIWLRAWQQVANCPELTLEQREHGYAVMGFLAGQMAMYRGMGAATPYRILSRHQYSGVFAGDALCRYIQRQCDLSGALAEAIAQNRADFRPVIDEMMQTYTTGFDHKWGLDGNWHLLQQAVEEPRPEYVTDGLVRLNADFATMCINNAGTFVNFGAENIGASEGYDAWQIVGRAAALTGDGRYQWWMDRMTRQPYKVFIMSMGWLGHWYQTALPPVEPTAMVGINRILISRPLHEDLLAGKGRLLGGTPVVNDVAREDGFSKITFRDGLGPDDQYLMLDGLGGVTYSGNDANALVEYSRFGVPLIVQYELKHEAFYQNTCSLARGNAGDPAGTFAELRAMADLRRVAYTQSVLSPLQGADHTRHLFFEKGGWVVVLDDLQVREADEYALACTWRGFGDPTLDAEAGGWRLHREAADLALLSVPLPGVTPPRLRPSVRTVEVTAAGQETNVQVLREVVAGTMAAGERYRFATVFRGERSGDKAPLRAVGLSADAIAITEPRTVIYGAPRDGATEVAGLMIGAAAFRLADDSAELVGLRRLEAEGEALVDLTTPVTVELDFVAQRCRALSPASRCTGTIVWEPEWARECSFAELAAGLELPDGRQLRLDATRLRGAAQAALAQARAVTPVSGAAPPEPSTWAETQPLVEAPAAVEASARADLTGDGADELLLARTDGRLVAMAADGAPLFDLTLGESPLLCVWAGELQGRTTVLAGARDGMVYACEADGALRWSYRNRHWGYGARPSVYSLAVGDLRGDGTAQLALGCHGGVTLLALDGAEPSFARFTEVYAHVITPMDPVRLPGESRDWLAVNSSGGGFKLVDPVEGVVVNGWVSAWGGQAYYQAEHRIDGQQWFVQAGFLGVGVGRLNAEAWRAGRRGYQDLWGELGWYFRTDGETRGLLVIDFDGDGTPEVISGNETGFLVAYSLTGQRLWKRLVGGPVTGVLDAGALAPGGLIVTGDDPGLVLLDRELAEVGRWSPPTGAGIARAWLEGERLLALDAAGQVWVVMPR